MDGFSGEDEEVLAGNGDGLTDGIAVKYCNLVPKSSSALLLLLLLLFPSSSSSSPSGLPYLASGAVSRFFFPANPELELLIEMEEIPVTFPVVATVEAEPEAEAAIDFLLRILAAMLVLSCSISSFMWRSKQSRQR